jgi:hypothetical protein
MPGLLEEMIFLAKLQQVGSPRPELEADASLTGADSGDGADTK